MDLSQEGNIASAVTVKTKKSRVVRRLILLFIAMIITPIISMHFGAAKVSIPDITQVFMSHIPWLDMETPSRIAEAIIWDNRAPRVVAGVGIGAILAVSGTALQAITRNPLAEPYVLGVSSGASSGAAVAIVYFGLTYKLGLSAMAFIGAALATILVLTIGGGRNRTVLHLVLAGLATGFIFQSITNLVIFSSDDPETARSVLFWMLGSLSHCTWNSALIVVGIGLLLTLAFWAASPVLDAIASGDNTALTVGVNPTRLRVIVTMTVSLAVAVAVAAAGSIGFVGLIVPHICRRIIDYSHRPLVLGVAMAGSIFLVLADTFARVVFAPAEIPIGVITGIVGAPILLVMIGGMSNK